MVITLELAGRNFGEHLGGPLITAYNKLMWHEPTKRSCVVSIESMTPGTGFVRALGALHKVVHAMGGEVVLANFPKQYLDNFLYLGLPSQPGFLEDASTRAMRQLSALPCEDAKPASRL